MATARKRRRNTVAQAKNIMRRAVEEILDPSPASVDSIWEHFESRCAYCGKLLRRLEREGHIDHAVPGGGNHLGNLLLACGSCNGDEKRDRSWQDFLRSKSPDPEFAVREERVRTWLDLHPRPQTVESADITRVRDELDALSNEFAAKCRELKDLVGKSPP